MDGKISEDSYVDLYKLLDEKIDDPFQDIGGIEERLLMGNYLAKHKYVLLIAEVTKIKPLIYVYLLAHPSTRVLSSVSFRS